MDVVVQGRHCAVTDRFRQYVDDKLSRLDRFAPRLIRLEVEVSKEHTRTASRCERVELTVYSRGPLVRAEASADDRFSALDIALDKLVARLRKAADRRRVHRGSRTPMSLAEATAPRPGNGTVRSFVDRRRGGRLGLDANAEPGAEQPGAEQPGAEEGLTGTEQAPSAPADTRATVAGIEVDGDGPLVVREKTHVATPMTLDQALYEMELVGHDFYLFIDAHTHQPSVVYRRRGYDYGVIRLEDAQERRASPAAAAGDRAGRATSPG